MSALKRRRRRTGRRFVLGLLLGWCLSGPAAAGAATAQVRTIFHAGLERTFRLYVPRSLDSDRPVALVIVLHGGGGNGANMERLTRGAFDTLAEKEHFIAVYPDGVERHWNDGRDKVHYRAQRENIDDVGFIATLIERVTTQLHIDRRRVYVTGISNGAMMAFRLGCELSDRIAAIAPVAGAMPAAYLPRCAPAKPVAVLAINGTDDPMIPWHGGAAHFGPLTFGRVVSVAQSVDFWVGRNRCAPTPARRWEPDRDPGDGTRVRRDAYGACRDGADVVLYTIEGGGHTWPGGYQYLPARRIGNTSRDIDAATLIWHFFEHHAR